MDFILNCFRKPTKLDAATLECQDASTSGAIIDALRGDAGFGKLSTFEGDAIVQRDEEDAEKLQKGVELRGLAEAVEDEVHAVWSSEAASECLACSWCSAMAVTSW